MQMGDLIAGLNLAKLVKVIVSGPMRTQEYKKIVVAPFADNFQASCFREDKVYHQNFASAAGLTKWLAEIFPKYRQFDIQMTDESIKILVSKSGNIKVMRSDAENKASTPGRHNREKDYILPEGKNIAWLSELGVTNKEGKVLHVAQKKFRQINRFLETVKDVLDNIPQGAFIIDAGCGKSYLSFALYHYLNEVEGKAVRLTGLDLKQDVMESCQRLSDKLGFAGLNFVCGDIADYQPPETPHAMISLHACDIATDYALYGAVKWGCRVILAAPCCQHELYSQINNDWMQPMLKHGILKEHFAALMTDTLRALMLEACGYKVSVIEFADFSHTSKNIMIRAVKRHSTTSQPVLEQYNKLAAEYGVSLKLHRLLYPEGGGL